jgi:serine/threonine protein phosphatase 1
MFERLIKQFSPADIAYAPPAGTRVYAIGDIHGRVDLLAEMQALIAADFRDQPPDRAVAVFLGDYLDRGSSSREVLGRLIDAPIADIETVHLMGNHEAFLLKFLDQPEIGVNWLPNGGDTTLASYDVEMPTIIAGEPAFEQTRDALRARMPASHLAFLRSLPRYHVEAGYTFVHAGIRPGRAIEDQDERDLLWIRNEFLDSQADHGCCVIHGHTITREADVRGNRIGIDTGAYFTGRLTCVVLEGTGCRWLQT